MSDTDEMTEISLEVECSEEYKEAEESGASVDLESQGDSGGGADEEPDDTSESRQRIEELIAQTRGDATDLATELQEQIARGEVEVETQNRKIIVRIREKGSFSSGSASLAGEYGLRGGHGRHCSPGQFPFHGGDEMHGQQHRRHGRVQVRIDETRRDDVVGKSRVDAMFVRIQPRLHRREVSDLDDFTAANRDGARPWHRGIHGDHGFCGVNGQHD